MFRPSPGHLQALKEKHIQDYIDFFNKNALWDLKCSQDVYFCCTFITHLVSIWDPTMHFYKKNLCDLGSVFFEGLEMNQRRSKHVALTICDFNVCEINCGVMD